MQAYNRKTYARTPDGRHVLVATVRNPLATESAVFPVDGSGKVTSAMHLYKTKHGPEDDLDVAHEQLVAAVAAGDDHAGRAGAHARGGRAGVG